MNHHLHPIVTHLFIQNHPAFPDLLQTLWDKGYTLCYKEKFRQATNVGSNVLTLDMRADMPGKSGHVKSMIAVTEDLDQEQDHVPECKCADTALNFFGSKWGPAPTCMLNLTQAIYKPEVYRMLQEGLPKAAEAVASAPAGAPLSANLSYLFYLIKRGEGFLDEAAVQIRRRSPAT